MANIEDKICRFLMEMYNKGEIDIITFRYYSRLMSLHELAMLTNSKKIKLKDIGFSLKNDRK